MKKRRRLIRIAVVSVICIGIALTIFFLSGADPDYVPPDTAEVVRADLSLTAPVRGNLEMDKKAYLSFGMTGTVKEVLVDSGDTVKKDQVLARLDAPSLEAGVETAEIQVELARIQMSMAQQQYDRAGETWKAPEGLEFLEDMVEFLVGMMGPDESAAKASLDMARLNWEMARLNLEMVKENLKMAKIVAPHDGVISEITISEGQALTAAAMAAPAMTLIGDGPMQMRGFIDELDIAMVEAGQNVTITLDALPDEELQGKVYFVSPTGTVMFGVVSYETVITLEDTRDGLRDGMSANADIIIEHRRDVLLIPNRAIRGTRDEPIVRVYIDGQIEDRPVVLGLSDGIDTEVVSGLEEGEQVVLPGRTSPVGNMFPMPGA